MGRGAGGGKSRPSVSSGRSFSSSSGRSFGGGHTSSMSSHRGSSSPSFRSSSPKPSASVSRGASPKPAPAPKPKPTHRTEYNRPDPMPTRHTAPPPPPPVIPVRPVVPPRQTVIIHNDPAPTRTVYRTKEIRPERTYVEPRGHAIDVDRKDLREEYEQEASRMEKKYGNEQKQKKASPLEKAMRITVIASASLAVLFLLVAAIRYAARDDSMTSTATRIPLNAQEAFMRDCIDDRLEWIDNDAAALKGMEHFYNETGVQPLLVITDNVYEEQYAPDSLIEHYMDEAWTDMAGSREDCVMLLFAEWQSGDYDAYYMAGENAKTVMDTEACDMLMANVNALYNDMTLDDSEFFGKVFSRTADRIMEKPAGMASLIAPALVFFLICITALIVLEFYKAKIRREENARKILETPLEKL